MSLSKHPPSAASWRWFGGQPLSRLAELGTDPTEPATWVKSGYAWLYQRLSPQQQVDLPVPIAAPAGPPESYVPVLAATGTGVGRLGFLNVQFDKTPRGFGDGVHWMAQAAANAVAAVFRQINPEIGWPHVDTSETPEGGGSSLGLAAGIACLAHLMGTHVSDRAVATGIIETDGRLRTVEPDTIPQKLEVAQRFGYRDVLLVRGQEGVPADCDLSIVSLSPAWQLAVFELLQTGFETPPAEALAHLLGVMDQVLVRTAIERQDPRLAMELTSQFTHDKVPRLVRHVAHDIRSRVLLQTGRLEKAERERWSAADNQPFVFDFPTGWLGEYLKWHQPAHHSVCALQRGEWANDAREHQELDVLIDGLNQSLAARRAGKSELLASLILSNTRALRLECVGLWEDRESALHQAWDDLVRHAGYWDRLFDYCQSIGLHDSTLRRQQNLCLRVAAAGKEVLGEIPAHWHFATLRLWPSSEDFDVLALNSYDLSAVIRWNMVTEQPLDSTVVESILTRAIDLCVEHRGAYPSYEPVELALHYGMGDDDQLRRAGECLSSSILFNVNLDDTSYLTLAAARAYHLLRRIGMDVNLPRLPRESSPFFERVRKLHAEPETMVRRCPF